MHPAIRSLAFRSTAIALVLAVALAATGVGASSDQDSDHDRARDAVQAGQVLPLKTVLERLEREQPGQVLEVELERDDGRWIYEVKLLQSGGRLVKLELDARSGEVLKRRDRDRDRRTP
jgi:uncharacterized membrane protein YkoI